MSKMNTPKEERLRKLSYSELKKQAKDRGIKGNLKADKLISLILENASDDDSFLTREQEIINSCKKLKQKKFDDDKLIASDTPRRETYTIDCPSDSILDFTNELIGSSASPDLRKKCIMDETLNITMSRGSEKKTSKKSGRKVSFVTPIRKSMRISAATPLYASVKDRPKTPIPSRSSSGRKSSTINRRISFAETPTEVQSKSSASKKSGKKGKRVSTPMPLSKCKRMNLSSSALKAPIATPEISFAEELPEEKESENVGLQSFKNADTPIPYEKSKRTFTPKPDVKKVATPRSVNPKHITLTPKPDAKKVTTPLSVNPKNLRTLTPKSGMKRVATPSSVSQENVRSLKRRSLTKKTIQQPISVKTKKRSLTPKSGIKTAGIPKLMSAKKMKGTPAPNFKKLHQKAFSKMESISDYQQRKAKNSAQKIKEHLHYHVPEKSLSKKLPLKKKGTNKLFGGIPFIPSVKNTKDINFNFGTTADKKSDASKAISRTRNALPKKFTGEGTKKPRKTPLKATKTPVKAQENTPLKRRLGFDVRASLSKKLPYKPHKGPLRPLTEANLYVSPSVSSLSQKAPENKLVVTKRFETRGVLKGVRKNRRFELQMKNRKAATD